MYQYGPFRVHVCMYVCWYACNVRLVKHTLLPDDMVHTYGPDRNPERKEGIGEFKWAPLPSEGGWVWVIEWFMDYSPSICTVCCSHLSGRRLGDGAVDDDGPCCGRTDARTCTGRGCGRRRQCRGDRVQPRGAARPIVFARRAQRGGRVQEIRLSLERNLRPRHCRCCLWHGLWQGRRGTSRQARRRSVVSGLARVRGVGTARGHARAQCVRDAPYVVAVGGMLLS